MKRKLLLLLLILSNISFSQSREGMELCFALQSNGVMSDADAEDALERILDVIGASKNFALIPCDNISNAVATAYKGTRYILYDKKFMSLINQNTNDWSSLFILAHEVGHHINGHSLDILLYTSEVVDAPTLENKRKQELEADEFAAFVLAKLGASLSQLNNIISLIADNYNDTFSTHPNRAKRLQSVKNGFNRGSATNKKSITKKSSPVYRKYNDESKYIGSKRWKRLLFNDPFNENLFEAFVKNSEDLKFSVKKNKTGTYLVGLYDLEQKYPEKSDFKFINYKDKYAGDSWMSERDVPINYTSKVDVIVMNSSGEEIYNSTTNEKLDKLFSLKFYLLGFEEGFNQIIFSLNNDLLIDYYTNVENRDSLLSGGPYQETLDDEIEKFISTLKVGSFIYFKLNFYLTNWNNSKEVIRAFGYRSKPKKGIRFNKLEYLTTPSLKKIEGSDVLSFSLSGSAKALAD